MEEKWAEKVLFRETFNSVYRDYFVVKIRDERIKSVNVIREIPAASLLVWSEFRITSLENKISSDFVYCNEVEASKKFVQKMFLQVLYEYFP